MGDSKFEDMLERVLRQDFAAGTEAFRDALLARCLDAVDAGDDGFELPDDDLGLLSAAGDLFGDNAVDE